MDNHLRGNIGASTLVVLNDDLLTDPLGQLLANQASDDVGCPARRKADDDADRPCRIGLRARDP
jgi:hypothetical protein